MREDEATRKRQLSEKQVIGIVKHGEAGMETAGAVS
jgi:hypothetical protein